MKNIVLTSLLAFGFIAENAWAGAPIVPEIDGGSAVLAIGLTMSVVALIRERARKK